MASSTIRELIEEANEDPRRGVGHTKDADAAFRRTRGRSSTWREADARCDSVPAEGETGHAAATANLSTGGTSIDRTDEMHPDNVTACEMAAGVIGLDIAGIDVLTPDISVPFRENGAVIIEVNAGPGIRMHTHPAEGRAAKRGGADHRHAVSARRRRRRFPSSPSPARTGRRRRRA